MHTNSAGEPAKEDGRVKPSRYDIATAGGGGSDDGHNKKDGPPGHRRDWNWYPDVRDPLFN